MFCSQCCSNLNLNANFCSNCGTQVGASDSSCQRKPAPSLSTSFTAFKKSNEAERQSKFQPKAKRGKFTCSWKSKAPPKDVAINIGLKRFKNDVFKTIHGSSLPVRVPINAGVAEIKQRATLKHANYNKTFESSLEYVLLYPDNSIVEHIPGTTESFNLEQYKNELSKK